MIDMSMLNGVDTTLKPDKIYSRPEKKTKSITIDGEGKTEYAQVELDAVFTAIKKITKGYSNSTTNSELKAMIKMKHITSSDVGVIRSILKGQGLINYIYVRTGRKASGSGRFTLTVNVPDWMS